MSTEEKLAESSAANAALSGQLENISPQLSSLETALTTSRQKLKEEQKLRRAAEQAQDEADQRLREMEQSLLTLREECDDVHEELAFKENELEETRLELEVEKQQLENDLGRMRLALSEAHRNMARQSSVLDDPSAHTARAMNAASMDSTEASMDEGYAKRLEEELELVTEQLIETEKRLDQAETEIQERDARIQSLQKEGRRDDDVDLIGKLQIENAEFEHTQQKLRDEVTATCEELALCREEINLQNEEIQALEQHCQTVNATLEDERARHRDAVHQLQTQVKAAAATSASNLGEAAILAAVQQEANKENENLLEQVAALENALKNAKKDYQGVLDELDEVNARFDEARDEAERAGREAASEELRMIMRTDAEHEISLVKETLNRLTVENKILQQKVDEAEMKVAAAKDNQEKEGASEAASEVVKQLQAQLTRSKEDLMCKDKEMIALTAALEERLAKAEDMVTHLEGELHSVKGQLAEAEAHLIVVRREKERKENVIPKSPTQANQSAWTDHDGGPSVPSAEDSSGRGRTLETAEDTDDFLLPRTPLLRPRSSSPSSVMRLELRLAEEVKKNNVLEREFNELQDQKRMSEIRIKRLEEDIKALQKQLFANNGDASTVTTQMSRLSSLGSAERGMDLMSDDEIAGKRLEAVIGSRDVKLMAEEIRTLDQKCNGQREYNAQLLSKMLHLQGNIQVYCRIRPMTFNEIQGGVRCVVEPLSETEVGCFDQRTNKWKSFAFDRVWGPDQSQTSVFQDVEPLALSVVDGFNACIFA